MQKSKQARSEKKVARQAEKHEKQTAAAGNVQAGGKRCEGGRQEGRQVPRNSSSQAGKRARELAESVKEIGAHSKEAFTHASSHSRLSSAKPGEPEKCGSASRSGVCWAVDEIMSCCWDRSPVGGGTRVYTVSSVGNRASAASAGPRRGLAVSRRSFKHTHTVKKS